MTPLPPAQPIATGRSRGLGRWAVVALLAGCARTPSWPTERVAEVVTPAAPLLNSIKATKDAGIVAHRGDLVVVGPEWPRLQWSGTAPEPLGPRDSPMAELRLAPGGSIYYGFSSDLGPPLEVPQAGWLCAQLAGADEEQRARRASCASLLRRVRLDESALVAFVEHPTEPWPIALFRQGRLVATAPAEPLTSARLVMTPAGPLLLTLSRWRRAEGAFSGGELVPFALLQSRIARLPAIRLDEVDTRDPSRVTSRLVNVEHEAMGVRLRGRQLEVAPGDGRVLHESVIDERYDLAALGPSL